jgi:low affinity Fe/Cu permease
MRLEDRFAAFSRRISHITGRAVTLFSATLLVGIWLATGHYFDYSDTWQLVINTATTIITFLMVFVIQNSQERDALSLHLKIDELIFSDAKAHLEMMDMEHMEERQLLKLKRKFETLAKEAHDVWEKKKVAR